MKYCFLVFAILFSPILVSAQACTDSVYLVATPPMPPGGYLPGTTVNICVTVSNYNQTTANWLCGVGIEFGPGWDTSTIDPYSPAQSCDGMGSWGWYDSCNSVGSGIIWGSGFYYDSPSGAINGVANYIPGDNFGDNCQTHDWIFCLTIHTSAGSTNPIPLNGLITITGDGSSGSWGAQGCAAEYYTFNSLLGGNSCGAAFFYATLPVQNQSFPIFNISAGITPTYLWTFGNGDSSILENPVYVYQLPGIYPVCLTLASANGCADTLCVNLTVGSNYWQSIYDYFISGNAYYDVDSNGVHDLFEPGLPNLSIQLQPAQVSVLTQSAGVFNIPVNSGDYIVSSSTPTGWSLTTDSSLFHVHVDSLTASVSGYDFGYVPNSISTSLDLQLFEGFSSCNWISIQKISMTNNGTTITNGMIIYEKPDSVLMISTTPPADSVYQNTYYWNYLNLVPFQNKEITLMVIKPNVIGYQYQTVVYADVRNAANVIQFSLTDTTYEIVSCSYDPNAKSVSPVEIIQGQPYTMLVRRLDIAVNSF